MESEPEVICRWCGKSYEGIFVDCDQGVRCAATVWYHDGWWLQGHYGSSYDTDRYRFVKNEPKIPAGTVCDDCISLRILAGDLELVEGSFI